MIGPTGLDLAPRVTCEMLDARFWLDRSAAPDRPFVAPEAVAAFNAHVHDALGIPPVLDLPDAPDPKVVRQALAAFQPLPDPTFDGLGQPIDAAFWERLAEAARTAADGPLEVRFGLAARRTAVRAFPTWDTVAAEPGEIALNRLQETTVDLGWPVAAVASSPGGAWRFCLTPHYWGWVARDDVAWAEREDVRAYAGAEKYATITASRAWIGLAAGEPALAQMGTRLPLLGRSERGLHVRVPQRDRDGALSLVEGVIPAEPEAAGEGVLPCTPATVITQAFKMLAERYAWGGSRGGSFGRDCSRLVRDAYAVSGVLLPRNGSQQSAVCRATAVFERSMSPDERRALLTECVPPGAILAMPGHVMLYLGAVDGEPFAIHSTLSSGFDGVIVSDLSLGSGSAAGSLLNRLTAALVAG